MINFNWSCNCNFFFFLKFVFIKNVLESLLSFDLNKSALQNTLVCMCPYSFIAMSNYFQNELGPNQIFLNNLKILSVYNGLILNLLALVYSIIIFIKKFNFNQIVFLFHNNPFFSPIGDCKLLLERRDFRFGICYSLFQVCFVDVSQ